MRNNNTILRPATSKDLQTQGSVRAWVLEEDNEIIAVAGVMIDGNYTGFLDIRKDLPIKAFWKASKEVMKELKKLNAPIGVIRDKRYNSSKRFLTRLGFKLYNIQNNQETYIWEL